nr:50S ribosome-binding GTPase [Bacillus pacificus]
MRLVIVPKLGEIIFSDTVGFIKNFPHNLVEAFHATLEEAIESDLLVHVIDYADEDHKSYIEQVEKVLSEIGIADKETICVYNKIDKLENIKPSFVPLEDSDSSVVSRVYLSAQNGDGLVEFYQALATFFNKTWINQTLDLPPKYSKVRAKKSDRSQVVLRAKGWCIVRV